jgi:hypothetical protein
LAAVNQEPPVPPASVPPAAPSPAPLSGPGPAGGGGAAHVFGSAKDAGYLPTDQERQAAFYAHAFAAGVAFFSGGFAFAVLAPYLATAVTGQKGPFVLFHVNQAALFQIAVTVLSGFFGISGFFCCVPWAVLPFSWIILGVGFPIYVGLGAQRGEWLEYPVIGLKVLREWKPIFT